MSLSDKEKMRVLEKRIRRLEDVIAKGGQPQYLFCPSLNCWLPSQCDDEGRLVIDPSDLDTRYLKLDGSNSMIEYLRLGMDNWRMRAEATGNKRFVLQAYIDSKWESIFDCYNALNNVSWITHSPLGKMYYGIRAAGSIASLELWTYNARKTLIGVYVSDFVIKRALNSTWIDCVKIITSSGVICLYNLPVVDPSIVGALWNDLGTVKVSSG